VAMQRELKTRLSAAGRPLGSHIDALAQQAP
jgi:hypothetical protein